jgi:hypothetical protein
MIEPCQETRAKLTRPAVSLHEGSAQLSKFTGPTSQFGINSVRSMRPHKVSQVSDSATVQAQQKSNHTGTERDEEMLLQVALSKARQSNLLPSSLSEQARFR